LVEVGGLLGAVGRFIVVVGGSHDQVVSWKLLEVVVVKQARWKWRMKKHVMCKIFWRHF
jgi:hypothetical protein